MTSNQKEIFKHYASLGVAILIFLFMMWGVIHANDPIIQEVEVIKYVEVQSDSTFDTSVLEQNWCGDFNDGKVRMIGAWWYADGVVEDEAGQLWRIEQAVSGDDWLLLWIADNHTPNDTTDDMIIKVWREAY